MVYEIKTQAGASKNEYQSLVDRFWEINNAIGAKTAQKGKLKAQRDLMEFAQSELNGLDIDAIFGKYAGFVKSYINAELVTNKFGKILYVKRG